MKARELPEPILHLVPCPFRQGKAPALPEQPPNPIGRAIRLMRSNLAKRWTVKVLARAVAMSRPVFARRFVERTGLSPLRFLTRCRMNHAALRLEESRLSIAAIALEVGYESEFAFNRAFKRFHGTPPGRFRRRGMPQTPTMRAAA